MLVLLGEISHSAVRTLSIRVHPTENSGAFVLKPSLQSKLRKLLQAAPLQHAYPPAIPLFSTVPGGDVLPQGLLGLALFPSSPTLLEVYSLGNNDGHRASGPTHADPGRQLHWRRLRELYFLYEHWVQPASCLSPPFSSGLKVFNSSSLADLPAGQCTSNCSRLLSLDPTEQYQFFMDTHGVRGNTLEAYAYNYTIYANGSAACAAATPVSTTLAPISTPADSELDASFNQLAAALSMQTPPRTTSTSMFKHTFGPTVVPLPNNGSLPIPASSVVLVAAVQNTSCISLSGMLAGGSASQDIVLGVQHEAGLLQLAAASPPTTEVPVDYACVIDNLSGSSSAESCYAGSQYPNASLNNDVRYYVFVANNSPRDASVIVYLTPQVTGSCNIDDHHTSKYTRLIAPAPTFPSSSPPHASTSAPAAQRNNPPDVMGHNVPTGPGFGNGGGYDVALAEGGFGK
ncbi:hypothetical protein WJX72_009434 [[Myrmecia] bisecta]|uniref:Uncharacterized protein n=1 Tax=[Myrmecia] bisecta TaxID=41462 RepID=A0AAW1R953_9CHLO